MKKGFTLVEIMIVVAIIGLLAAIAIPSFLNARTRSQTSACQNNLRLHCPCWPLHPWPERDHDCEDAPSRPSRIPPRCR